MLKFKTSCAVLANLSSNLLNEVSLSLFGILKQAYVCAISSLTSTFAISSPDEFLSTYLLFLHGSPITSSTSDSPLCTSITPSLFHSWLKTYLFHKSYPPKFHFFLPDCLHGLLPGSFLLATQFLILFFPYFFVSGPCARLSWPSRQLLSAH